MLPEDSVCAESQGRICKEQTAMRLVQGQPLPPFVRDERACNKCFQKTGCALSHKVGFVRNRLQCALCKASRCFQSSDMVGPAISGCRDWLRVESCVAKGLPEYKLLYSMSRDGCSSIFRIKSKTV